MQNPNHKGFVAPDRRYDCRQCANRHGDAFGFPPLDDENVDAWQLYLLLDDQVIVGGFDVIGLDYQVVPVAFDSYRVPEVDRPLLFEKLIILNSEARTYRRRLKERQEAEKKAEEKFRQQGL